MPHANKRNFLPKKKKQETSFESLSFQQLTSTKLHLHHNQMMEHHFTSAEKIDHITLYQYCHQHRCFLNVDRLETTKDNMVILLRNTYRKEHGFTSAEGHHFNPMKGYSFIGMVRVVFELKLSYRRILIISLFFCGIVVC